MQRPTTKVRAGVETLEARCVPSAIGFHANISAHLGSGQASTTPRSISRVAASANQPTTHVKSISLSDGRAPATLVKECARSVRPSQLWRSDFPRE